MQFKHTLLYGYSKVQKSLHQISKYWMTYIQNSAQTSYKVQHLLEWSFFQQSCGLLGTVLYLHDPIPGNLVKTLLHITQCIPKSVFNLCLLKSKVVSSCYRG